MTVLPGSAAALLRRGGTAVIYSVWAAMAVAQTGPPAPARPLVLSNITEIWNVSGEAAGQPQRIKTEVVIYYIDPYWHCAWGECQGQKTYLPIYDSPTTLKAGQRIAIDGLVSPTQERLLWDKTEIQVLQEDARPKALEVSDLSKVPADINGSLVLAQGVIDGLQTDDAHHLAFGLVSGAMRANAVVLTEAANLPLPFKEGDYVRLKAVYVARLNRDETVIDYSLWVAQRADVEVTGSLSQDPRFEMPATPIENINGGIPGDQLIRVEGIVRTHEAGKLVTLWDDTGQISVQSLQMLPVRIGDRVEAIGFPYQLGVQQCLRNALYRVVQGKPPTNSTESTLSLGRPLRLAAQIQDLSPVEVKAQPSVNLWAVLMWSHRDTAFVYVQDASGGIRVVNPRWQDTNHPVGTVVRVQGEVAQGSYVPVVTNAVISRAGFWGFDPPQPVSLEQALTGVEDGRWVEMRGFVRKVTQVKGLLHLDLTTSRGKFQAWIPDSPILGPLLGSVVRIDGVCSVTANKRRQLTGIRLYAPDPSNIKIEEPAPADVFVAAFRPLGDLRRFNAQSDLNQRVRTTGIVVLHQPGRYLDLQDGPDSVLALSQQHDPLRPGDRVEVVGFPGNEGGKFLLREAVFRRLSSGPEPAPIPLPAVDAVNVSLDGLLVKAEGILLNTFQKNDRLRMLIRSGGATFEAGLESANDVTAGNFHKLPIGSRLALTGLYEVQNDEYGRPGSFLLLLRSGDDVRVLARPSWWTLPRMLTLLVVVLIVFAISLIWGFLISRKNSLLRQAKAELQLSNSQLEVRVYDRTLELRNQVVAAERARADLAEAQQTLVRASRSAGMAEVATGVLHNVGNVLNSVNVSTSCLRDRTGRLPVELVCKTASLLTQPPEQLARYLRDDPKGRLVPEFLAKLGESLTKEKLSLGLEIDSLAKNVEHINAIVSMQQDHARVGGVQEELQIKDVVEDAIRINAAAFDRHSIELARHYQPVDRVLLDRHKLMQILVNLLNNAKHALAERPGGKQIVVSLSSPGPHRVRVSVADNGVGIPPENLQRIFSQGFTTRKDGHGFGLHNGALAARELGGSLSVQSGGSGQGAEFTLEFLCHHHNGSS